MVNPCLTKVKDRSHGRDFVYFLAVFTIRIMIGYRNGFEFVLRTRYAVEKIIKEKQMGKGDRKTKKGKITRGSYGKSRRPKKVKSSVSKKKTT